MSLIPTHHRTLRSRKPDSPRSTLLLAPSLRVSVKRTCRAEALSRPCSRPRATPAQVQSLIVSHEQFVASTRSFPASLGPHGAAAWKALADSSVATRFEASVQTGIAVGLGHLAPPFATSSSQIGEIARVEVAWANSLTAVVLASSVDLRTATADQANSATQALVVTYALTSLLVVLALGAVLILSRHVRRPLDQIVAAATSVQEGELDIPALDESGPKELALASAAFNEMASTLRAVQAQAIALSDGDLDNPVLQRQVPGRTGAALQTALNQLHRSVQAGETEREALLERATRDSLTGLLNRGAALEALTLDLAAARRSQGELVLTLFFIDLDDLKTINDSIGHDGGDVAIRAVAEALKHTTRASDVIARFGGDEFVVGWLGNPDSDVPEQLARRISAHVAGSQVGAPEGAVALACSIGVAVSEPSDSTVEDTDRASGPRTLRRQDRRQRANSLVRPNSVCSFSGVRDMTRSRGLYGIRRHLWVTIRFAFSFSADNCRRTDHPCCARSSRQSRELLSTSIAISRAFGEKRRNTHAEAPPRSFGWDSGRQSRL